tara:strand:+ start:17478 stop:17999 length:522 start_codon:yes stop_codon:yes gene_type:complete
MAINVSIYDAEVRPALEALQDAIGNVDPVLAQIGEYLIDSTKDRFKTATDPNGNAWAANKDSTLENYANRFKTSFTKKGNRSKKGRDRIANKKPLTGETKQLQKQIFYHVSNGELQVGSPLIYAATQQFGAKAKSYGPKTPWGDIEARPFLGISDKDETEVLAIIYDYLDAAV